MSEIEYAGPFKDHLRNHVQLKQAVGYKYVAEALHLARRVRARLDFRHHGRIHRGGGEAAGGAARRGKCRLKGARCAACAGAARCGSAVAAQALNAARSRHILDRLRGVVNGRHALLAQVAHLLVERIAVQRIGVAAEVCRDGDVNTQESVR